MTKTPAPAITKDMNGRPLKPSVAKAVTAMRDNLKAAGEKKNTTPKTA